MVFGQVCKVHFGSFLCFGEGDFMPILFKQVGTLAFTGDAGGTSRQVGHVSPAGVVAAGMLAQAVISGGGNTQKKRELS